MASGTFTLSEVGGREKVRYDLLSELAAQLETSGGGGPSSWDEIVDGLVETLWAILSKRADPSQPPGDASSPRASEQEQEEVTVDAARFAAIFGRDTRNGEVLRSSSSSSSAHCWNAYRGCCTASCHRVCCAATRERS
jgi:hypothetical protein